MRKVLKAVGVVLAAAALLAAGYELGAMAAKPSPIERLEAGGLVIDGGPIRAAAKWRM